MDSSESESDVPTAYVNDGYTGDDKTEKEVTTTTEGTQQHVAVKDQAAEVDKDELKGYGCGSCQPRCLQWLNSPGGYLFCLCFYLFVQGMTVNGLVYTIISTLERRFNLNSVQSAFISSSYDFCAMFFVIFITYFGETRHKPRLIGIGAFIFAVGSAIFTLPHFLTGTYDAEAAEFDTCDANRTLREQCDVSGEDAGKYYPVFLVAQAFHALGASTIYNLGLTHLDENVEAGTAAVFQGIFWSIALLGPAAGFLLGGIYLNIYTDLTAEDVTISPSSPIWVGAWWLGFVVSAVLAVLVAFPLLGFNKRLPGYTAAQSKRRNETRTGSSFQGQNKLSDFPKAVLTLLKNPTYTFITAGVISEAFMVSLISVFGPKILESLFNVTSSNAALLAGLTITPAGIIGPIVGGYIMKRFNMNVSQTLKLCVVCLVISGLISLGFLLTCPDIPFAGVTTVYGNSSLQYSEGAFNLTAPCNALCQCEELYDPVCGSDGIMYYSACHAGCTVEVGNQDGGAQGYSDCACIPSIYSSPEVFGTAEASRCPSECPYLIPFLAVAFAGFLFTYLIPVPYVTATMRCVDYSQRTFALGVQTFFNKGLGTVPGPIAFGALLDRACLLTENKCDGLENCWLYDNSRISLYLVLVISACRVWSICSFTGALLTYKPPKEDGNSVDGKKCVDDVEMT